MTLLRDQMWRYIGSGCLSLDGCPVHNGADRLGSNGPGPQRWVG